MWNMACCPLRTWQSNIWPRPALTAPCPASFSIKSFTLPRFKEVRPPSHLQSPSFIACRMVWKLQLITFILPVCASELSSRTPSLVPDLGPTRGPLNRRTRASEWKHLQRHGALIAELPWWLILVLYLVCISSILRTQIVVPCLTLFWWIWIQPQLQLQFPPKQWLLLAGISHLVLVNHPT